MSKKEKKHKQDAGKKAWRQLTAAQLQQEILNWVEQNPKKRYNAKQLIKSLRISNNKDAVQYALDKLLEKGQLSLVSEKYKVNKQNYAPASRKDVLEGVVDMTRTGSAYIVCEGQENDIFVAARHINGALHGDTVRVQVNYGRGRGRPEGVIVEVLERATEYFVGTLHVSRKYALVFPDRINMPMDIYVDLQDTKEARDGDKVVVKVIKWPGGLNKSPIGRVTAVLGATGSSDLEMKSILIFHGFNIEFPEEVMAEAHALPKEISNQEVGRRLDLRGVTTFTIDPEDAKDFDDALSLRRLDNGDLEIGVHIADVSHYIHPDTALDKEAYLRSTSVYLVDRVCPMLPEQLSNELCSLRPGEEKLTFSAIFVFDASDKIKSRWFGRTVTLSDRRFSYEEAQHILDAGEGDFADELGILNRIAKKMRRNRFRKGAINFETEEVKFRLDEDGVPVEVYVKERKDAHLLIEEFMLLANREVATFMAKKSEGQQEVPFIYRIHDQPDLGKIAEFARFAGEMGFRIDPNNIARSFNELAKAAEKNELLKILEPLAIRTMAKAEYAADNIGHYGLAFEHYTHFTSPIRRYSDVLAHRILWKNLEDTQRMEKERLMLQCKHISNQERKANDAERESIKYKQVEFIGKHLGQVFEGVVSGMIEKGIFIELMHNKCEGLLLFGSMEEPFDLDGGRLRARGRRTGKLYKIGDRVMVRVVSANLQRRQIEMELAEEATPPQEE